MKKLKVSAGRLLYLLGLHLVVVGFFLLAAHFNYLFFHLLIELFSMLVAIGIFIVAWNTRKVQSNKFVLFVAVGFFYVGLIDFFHTLTYKGMGVFPSIVGANVPTQLWIVGRFMLAVTIVLAPTYFRRQLKVAPAMVLYAAITGGILFSIFYLGIFPQAYIDGSGLTGFKIVSEYVISGLFLLGIIRLWRHKDRFGQDVFWLFLGSWGLSVFTELIFTFYVGVFDFFNFLGHLAKLMAYFLVYKAVVEVGIRKPFSLIFRDMKRLEQRKNEFIGLAAHEMKTPLTVIKLYAQILERIHIQERDQRSRAYAQKIIFQSDFLTGLVNELLDLNQMEVGKFQYRMEVIDLSRLVKRLAADLQLTTSAHTLVVKVDLKVVVSGDEERLTQVIINLIANAIKYSPHGGEIIISLSKRKKWAAFSVQDFGIGISPKNIRLLFSRFYRTKRGKAQAKGLGLGLYLAKQIIQKHRGKIWLKSTLNKGTTVFFRLPLSKKDAKSSKKKKS